VLGAVVGEERVHLAVVEVLPRKNFTSVTPTLSVAVATNVVLEVFETLVLLAGLVIVTVGATVSLDATAYDTASCLVAVFPDAS
jgi:high-affinity Fe2+/Pb2+ permease